MPTPTRIQNALRGAFGRWPALQETTLQLLDLWTRVALLPFRRSARRGDATEREDLVAATTTYNEAAERYFQHHRQPSALLDKPFSDRHNVARHLIDAGIILDRLRLSAGDVVMEFGAGTGWLSHFIHRCGYQTIAVDVSPTALALARQLFDREPSTNKALDPQFLPYDGHRLPVGDATCDRIVVNDAFHHVPNQGVVLREMHRVLTPDGFVVMSEPGRGHADTAQSRSETDEWGVLENELVIEDVAALARACGFRAATVVVASPFVFTEVPAEELSGFVGGHGFARHWKAFTSALDRHHYIVLYKGQVPRRVSDETTSASIVVEPPGPCTLPSGSVLPVRLRIVNTGTLKWEGGSTPRAGWVRVGAHLYRGDGTGGALDYDWWRQALPAAEVPPGHDIMADATLPLPAEPGTYTLEFDMVVEGQAWFGSLGSPTTRVTVTVSPSPGA